MSIPRKVFGVTPLYILTYLFLFCFILSPLANAQAASHTLKKVHSLASGPLNTDALFANEPSNGLEFIKQPILQIVYTAETQGKLFPCPG